MRPGKTQIKLRSPSFLISFRWRSLGFLVGILRLTGTLARLHRGTGLSEFLLGAHICVGQQPAPRRSRPASPHFSHFLVKYRTSFNYPRKKVIVSDVVWCNLFAVFFYLGFTAHQDYFTHFERSQSLDGAKMGDPREKPSDYPQAELSLSHM